MSIAVIVLLITYMLIMVFAMPVVFDIGYKAGRENALKHVASEIPQGLSLEQKAWISRQMESR